MRDEVAGLWAMLGETGFRARLAEVDPESAGRIAPGDRQRLKRALEVAMATGAPIGAFRATDAPPLAPGAWRGLLLDPPREVLRARCEARLAAMPGAGALDEIRALVERGLSADLPVMKALGVRDFADYLAGRISLDEALDRAGVATRRYLKRQQTWFRHQAPDWLRLSGVDADEIWRRLPSDHPQIPSLTPP